MPLNFKSKKVVHKNSAGTMYWVDNSYLYISYNDIDTIRLEDISEYHVAISEQFDHKVPLIIERTYHYSVDDDAFQFSKEFSPFYLSAIAIVDDKPNAKLARNYAKERLTPHIPIEGFTTINTAIDWIKTNRFDCGDIPSGKP